MVDRNEVVKRALSILRSEDPFFYHGFVLNFPPAQDAAIKIVEAYNRAEAELQKEETQALADRYSGQAQH